MTTRKKVRKNDFGVKIGTKDQVVWEAVKKNALEVIRQANEQLLIQKGIVELADSKISAEKRKI